MKSEDLIRSPIWSRMASAIARDFRAGVPFEQIHEMNIAMKQGTLEPYRKHRRALDALLWYDDPGPKKIIELGAGYGGMRSFWPEGSTVYNVDLPEMLEIQEGYIKGLGVVDGTITTAVPFTEADSIDFSGAYLFSTWALTETTFETWDYYIERAAALAGAYVVGWRGFKDIPDQVWPWERLRDAFKTVRSDLTPYLDYDGDPTNSLELAAVNR